MAKDDKYRNKALVIGHIGLVRSLGEEGVPVIVAKEGTHPIERYSRYCLEYINLPNLETDEVSALEILEAVGKKYKEKLVAFFNGESDVLLFSKHRDRLGKYYNIVLSEDDLIKKLVDKSEFAGLAERYKLPVPRTIIPRTIEKLHDLIGEFKFPFILKPIRQRDWHKDEIIDLLGGIRKAILITNRDEFDSYIDKLHSHIDRVMIQEYIPGGDQQHYDFHVYIDKSGVPRGYITGHKMRIYPIHFGQGCYTELVDEPRVANICIEALLKIGYVGSANINLKLHPDTNEFYILEINPRFSLWTILDAACGVNLPFLQYKDALGQDIENLYPKINKIKWLWFSRDFKSMLDYRRCDEITFWQWIKSYDFGIKHVFHVFSFNDPCPYLACYLLVIRKYFHRIINKIF